MVDLFSGLAATRAVLRRDGSWAHCVCTVIDLVESIVGLVAWLQSVHRWWCSKALRHLTQPQTIVRHLCSAPFTNGLQISTGLDSATTFEICTRLRAICHLMHVSGRGAVCPMRSRRNPASRAVQQEELGAYRQAVAALPSLPLKP